jgi:hypothetical protein
MSVSREETIEKDQDHYSSDEQEVDLGFLLKNMVTEEQEKRGIKDLDRPLQLHILKQ